MRMLKTNDSSHIDEIIFDDKDNTMYVKFISGTMYKYAQVHIDVFGRLASARSIGEEFAESIRFNPSIPYISIPKWPEFVQNDG